MLWRIGVEGSSFDPQGERVLEESRFLGSLFYASIGEREGACKRNAFRPLSKEKFQVEKGRKIGTK